MTSGILPCPLCGNHAFIPLVEAGYPVWCVTDRCLRLPPRSTRERAKEDWNNRSPTKGSSPAVSKWDWREIKTTLQVGLLIVPPVLGLSLLLAWALP